MSFDLRLDEVLVKNHISTARRVRRLLQTHKVEVNGLQVFQGGVKVNVWRDDVFIDGKKARILPDLYFMMNKAGGFVCSSLEGDERSIFEGFDSSVLFPEGLGPLHSVGRLDMDTEGLLILTTDGDFSHLLTDPKSHVTKTYLVTLRDEVDEGDWKLYKAKVKEGIFVPREKTEPSFTAKSAVLEPIDSRCCHLTVTEGKFHQVKRMFLALGNEVTALKRISMGGLSLDPELKPGTYRKLDEDELCLLRGF